ncbi:MAG: pilus assembly protein PilM [Phycisphaerales bacterium]|nr:pilus assembly protein PilM [Phycisphaerales bacterium]
MRLSFLPSNVTPIAIDFGTSSVKLLQSSTDEHAQVVAIDEFEIPDAVRMQPERRTAFLLDELPKALRRGGFKGRKTVCSPQSSQTLVLHMQVPPSEGSAREAAIKQQLQAKIGCDPSAVVVRWVDVPGAQRQGQPGEEVICFAAAREEIMRTIELLKKAKLEVVGVHSEPQALIWSFRHLHRRDDDRRTTSMYIDIGWGSTKVAIANGGELTFAKSIQVGGRLLDQAVATRLKCDLVAAHTHRIGMAATAANPAPKPMPDAPGPEEAPAILRAALAKSVGHSGTATATERRSAKIAAALRQPVLPSPIPGSETTIDLTEHLDAIADELLMCARYHASLFPGRTVERAIFLGGESRHVAICQHIARTLRLPAQLGDPLARLLGPASPRTAAMQNGVCQPGWAVAAGLCMETLES